MYRRLARFRRRTFAKRRRFLKRLMNGRLARLRRRAFAKGRRLLKRLMNGRFARLRRRTFAKRRRLLKRLMNGRLARLRARTFARRRRFLNRLEGSRLAGHRFARHRLHGFHGGHALGKNASSRRCTRRDEGALSAHLLVLPVRARFNGLDRGFHAALDRVHENSGAKLNSCTQNSPNSATPFLVSFHGGILDNAGRRRHGIGSKIQCTTDQFPRALQHSLLHLLHIHDGFAGLVGDHSMILGKIHGCLHRRLLSGVDDINYRTDSLGWIICTRHFGEEIAHCAHSGRPNEGG